MIILGPPRYLHQDYRTRLYSNDDGSHAEHICASTRYEFALHNGRVYTRNTNDITFNAGATVEITYDTDDDVLVNGEILIVQSDVSEMLTTFYVNATYTPGTTLPHVPQHIGNGKPSKSQSTINPTITDYGVQGSSRMFRATPSQGEGHPRNINPGSLQLGQMDGGYNLLFTIHNPTADDGKLDVVYRWWEEDPIR